MAHPVPSGLFDLATGNLIATGHIKSLGDNKQCTSNAKQGLPSKTSEDAMREIALSYRSSREGLVACPGTWEGE